MDKFKIITVLIEESITNTTTKSSLPMKWKEMKVTSVVSTRFFRSQIHQNEKTSWKDKNYPTFKSSHSAAFWKKGVLKDWESTCSKSVFLNKDARFCDQCSFSVGGKKTLELLFSVCCSNIAMYLKWTF